MLGVSNASKPCCGQQLWHPPVRAAGHLQTQSQAASPAPETGADTRTGWDWQQWLVLGRMDTATAHVSQRHRASDRPAHLGDRAMLGLQRRWDRVAEQRELASW